ncbi:MAG TPA: exodeoxyribonuclease VII large subunit [Pyrinomonadaceae bacterium]|jgi:exodeoxyribonuclease VII large subunit|nr:exodeoxyribonuclease VII large subunit [Pyrinomonadaceae bacterium]
MTHPLLLSLFDETERRPLTVSELTQQVRAAVETRFRSVWVEGEVSNFRAHTSGHWYFTIKDETAQLRATCFRNTNRAIRFRPTDGLQVRARGRLTVYEPRGEYELEVEGLDPVGAGALRVAFEQMRERLSSEGLFDEERKRPLPLFPRRIGIVTSASGAALRDILTVISRRTRTVDVLIAPARVQGVGAALEIVRAIELLNRYHLEATAAGRADEGVDAIIVGRGGGSIEDLWAFNEEAVARAIASSAIPVISAVGHETDTTIADFAADVRAATPSAAAELVAAREDELEALVFNHTRDLVRAIRFRIMDERSRVAEAAMSQGFDDVRARLRHTGATLLETRHRIETLVNRATALARRRTDALSCRLSPARLAARVAESRVRFAVLCAARDAAARSRLDDERARLAVMVASLDALSPLAVLKRGYALARDREGRLVRDARELKVGDTLKLRLAVGAVTARVEKQENN